jgi:hypothetical protein
VCPRANSYPKASAMVWTDLGTFTWKEYTSTSCGGPKTNPSVSTVANSVQAMEGPRLTRVTPPTQITIPIIEIPSSRPLKSM